MVDNLETRLSQLEAKLMTLMKESENSEGIDDSHTDADVTASDLSLTVPDRTNTGCYLSMDLVAMGGSRPRPSSRHLKTEIALVDPGSVLAALNATK